MAELYLVRSDSAAHFLVALDTTLDEMEFQNLKTPLTLFFLLQDIINPAPVSPEYHLARLYLLRVAHLGPRLRMKHEHVCPKNYMDHNKSEKKGFIESKSRSFLLHQ